MKIFLLTSYLGGNEPLVYPLGLACLKSVLPDHQVETFDLNTSRQPFSTLENRMREFAPDVVGISLRNIDSTNKRKVVFYYRYLKKTIDVIQASSDAKIVVGGSGFSMFARHIMNDDPRISYGIYLEGEQSFPKLMENIQTPQNVPGVLYRRNGKVVFNPAPPSAKIGRPGSPDFSAFSIDTYRPCRDAIGVETKRGCALNCIYCIYPFLNGRRYRIKDPHVVVDEIEGLVRDNKIAQFMFVDSVFNIPKDHAENICRAMIERRLPVRWSAWLSEKGLDADFVRLLIDAGCNHVIFSPDGFSDPVLKRLGKNILNRDIRRAFKVLQAFPALEISYNFFKNPPGQTWQNFLTMAFFCFKAKWKLRQRIHFELNALRIEPHTRLHEIALAENIVRLDDNLLEPKYYTQQRTRYIEKLLDLMLQLKGR